MHWHLQLHELSLHFKNRKNRTYFIIYYRAYISFNTIQISLYQQVSTCIYDVCSVGSAVPFCIPSMFLSILTIENFTKGHFDYKTLRLSVCPRGRGFSFSYSQSPPFLLQLLTLHTSSLHLIIHWLIMICKENEIMYETSISCVLSSRCRKHCS